jgi:hypothetical protein
MCAAHKTDPTESTIVANLEGLFTNLVKIIAWSFYPSQLTKLLYMLADSIFRLTRKRYQEELWEKIYLGLKQKYCNFFG